MKFSVLHSLPHSLSPSLLSSCGPKVYLWIQTIKVFKSNKTNFALIIYSQGEKPNRTFHTEVEGRRKGESWKDRNCAGVRFASWGRIFIPLPLFPSPNFLSLSLSPLCPSLKQVSGWIGNTLTNDCFDGYTTVHSGLLNVCNTRQEIGWEGMKTEFEHPSV